MEGELELFQTGQRIPTAPWQVGWFDLTMDGDFRFATRKEGNKEQEAFFDLRVCPNVSLISHVCCSVVLRISGGSSLCE